GHARGRGLGRGRALAGGRGGRARAHTGWACPGPGERRRRYVRRRVPEPAPADGPRRCCPLRGQARRPRQGRGLVPGHGPVAHLTFLLSYSYASLRQGPVFVAATALEARTGRSSSVVRA